MSLPSVGNMRAVPPGAVDASNREVDGNRSQQTDLKPTENNRAPSPLKKDQSESFDIPLPDFITRNKLGRYEPGDNLIDAGIIGSSVGGFSAFMSGVFGPSVVGLQAAHVLVGVGLGTSAAGVAAFAAGSAIQAITAANKNKASSGSEE